MIAHPRAAALPSGGEERELVVERIGGQGHPLGARRAREREVEVRLAEQPLDLLRRRAGGDDAADQRADRRARDRVGHEAVPLRFLQQADVGDSPRAAAAQGERPAGRRGGTPVGDEPHDPVRRNPLGPQFDRLAGGRRGLTRGGLGRRRLIGLGRRGRIGLGRRGRIGLGRRWRIGRGGGDEERGGDEGDGREDAHPQTVAQMRADKRRAPRDVGPRGRRAAGRKYPLRGRRAADKKRPPRGRGPSCGQFPNRVSLSPS